MDNKRPTPARPSTERKTFGQAMADTGTTTPKAALAKMNEGRHGHSRFIYMPMAPDAPGRTKERLRRAKREMKAQIKAQLSAG